MFYVKRGFCQQLNARLGLERWRGNDIDFAAVGDEEGLFIVTVNGRIGLAGKWSAHPLPTTVVVRGTKEQMNISQNPEEQGLHDGKPCSSLRKIYPPQFTGKLMRAPGAMLISPLRASLGGGASMV